MDDAIFDLPEPVDRQVHEMFARFRRELVELVVTQRVVDDPELVETEKVLMQKRGCRR